MIEINFTEAEKEKLAQARYKQTHPHQYFGQFLKQSVGDALFESGYHPC